MTEVRVEVTERRTLEVLDGYCQASGRCRAGVINEVLAAWAEARLREATMICRVAGINPQAPAAGRKGGGE